MEEVKWEAGSQLRGPARALPGRVALPLQASSLVHGCPCVLVSLGVLSPCGSPRGCVAEQLIDGPCTLCGRRASKARIQPVFGGFPSAQRLPGKPPARPTPQRWGSQSRPGRELWFAGDPCPPVCLALGTCVGLPAVIQKTRLALFLELNWIQILFSFHKTMQKATRKPHTVDTASRIPAFTPDLQPQDSGRQF